MGGYGTGSGGHNRTHATVESFYRIDSFWYYDFLVGDEYLFLHDKVFYPHSRQPDIVYHVQEGRFEILTGIKYSPLHLSKVPGINGNGQRVFFECPHCETRVRYLYKNRGNYMCRHCLNANYKSQQISGMKKFRSQMENILEKLGYFNWRYLYPHTNIEDLVAIPKSRYMRYTEYEELMRKFRELQEECHERQLSMLLKGIPREWLNEILENGSGSCE